jgi:hypothetical protein
VVPYLLVIIASLATVCIFLASKLFEQERLLGDLIEKLKPLLEPKTEKDKAAATAQRRFELASDLASKYGVILSEIEDAEYNHTKQGTENFARLQEMARKAFDEEGSNANEEED